MDLKNEKISIISQEPKMKRADIIIFLEKKIVEFQNTINETILSAQTYKRLEIIGASELNVCITTLEELYESLNEIYVTIKEKKKIDIEQVITKLQNVNNEISVLFKSFGTHSIESLISVCFGVDFMKTIITESNSEKFDVIKKYVHPIGYKVMAWKDEKKNKKTVRLSKNRIVEDFMIVETAKDFDCFDLSRTSKNFQTKVYGIKISIQNVEIKKTLIICGIVDDIIFKCINHNYITEKINTIHENKPEDDDFNSEGFKRFVDCLTIKELLIYNEDELYNKFVGYMNQIHLMKQKTISQIVKEFLNNELYGQRTTLIQLLIKDNDSEFQYLAYLLYDLLSSDNQGTIDNQEQTLLFDSLPWNVKKYFRDAMKQTINYTNTLSNFDNSKIPLEQQICLMKANDIVKEKAMNKLKEVKAKSEDSGSKARQYLEALLRIPFGIYREEYILKIMKQLNTDFISLVKKLKENNPELNVELKKKYTTVEIELLKQNILDEYIKTEKENNNKLLNTNLIEQKRSVLINNISKINTIIKTNNLNIPKLCHSGKKNKFMQDSIKTFLNNIKDNKEVTLDLREQFIGNSKQYNFIKNIETSLDNVISTKTVMNNQIVKVNQILENAVHGHQNAKRQIERIIGQWMNGEQSGYCFGFEGPPGVGKTSLAKEGLAYCLEDNDKSTRPFSFIAIGGSSNGSTLDGHNYTYVGSTWGRIVDILMDNKCMNPIIFIDELDKVSRTEHGREIIGILTHLVDPTQNTTFQDKYFNGIDLDLSKALFIFSYNDVDAIDRILLDRIHRIKFDPLSVDDKIVIVRKYILPEIFNKMGLKDVITFSDDVIIYLIEKFTYEPGVRKLKELLFEIIGEINLQILKEEKDDIVIPFEVTCDEIKHKFLKERHEIKHKEIPESPCVGTINGLWANALGKGGIIPIETHFCYSPGFLDLKLTGMQGDVMQESMSVAKTLACSLTSNAKMKTLISSTKMSKLQGIHIHCPEGAVPKDGPSAGTAITVVLYSLLNKKKIKNTIAITGEINLQGQVTAIGGLDLKILGGIRAGVKEFIYPKENNKDFQQFMEKFSEKPELNNIIFHEVENIHQVLPLVFV
jgi:ATP-dependent Lon protease